MPKEGSCCNFLSIMLIDSVFRTSKNYYSQDYLERCKLVAKQLLTKRRCVNILRTM